MLGKCLGYVKIMLGIYSVYILEVTLGLYSGDILVI